MKSTMKLKRLKYADRVSGTLKGSMFFLRSTQNLQKVFLSALALHRLCVGWETDQITVFVVLPQLKSLSIKHRDNLPDHGKRRLEEVKCGACSIL